MVVRVRAFQCTAKFKVDVLCCDYAGLARQCRESDILSQDMMTLAV